MGNSIEHSKICETRVMCHTERRCMALLPVGGSRWQRRGNPRSWSYTGESPEWTDHDDPEQLAIGTGPAAEAVARRTAEFYTRICDSVEYRGLHPDGSVAWQYPENACEHTTPRNEA